MTKVSEIRVELRADPKPRGLEMFVYPITGKSEDDDVVKMIVSHPSVGRLHYSMTVGYAKTLAYRLNSSANLMSSAREEIEQAKRKKVSSE